ncbi:MAG: nickel insertion protein, partial [Halanaerobium sp.]
MEDILYFDIKSGISGDMTIASLLDLGLDQNKFLNELKKLKLDGFEIEISTVQKNGITA